MVGVPAVQEGPGGAAVQEGPGGAAVQEARQEGPPEALAVAPWARAPDMEEPATEVAQWPPPHGVTCIPVRLRLQASIIISLERRVLGLGG